MVTTDVAATLRCWAFDVDLGGATYTLPAHPADRWLLAIHAGTTMAVLPGLLADRSALNDAIIDGTVTVAELTATYREVLAAAAGMPWWVALRLVQLAEQTWIGAELLLRGVQPAALSLAGYLAAARRVATRDMAADKEAQFRHSLEAPPAGVDPAEWYDEDAAADGFMSALGAAGGYAEADA